ncbi:hypothetical protein CPB86DRAFT_798717 [Serendipita vermifera]|nr:hypothetical protein CPB86DRAFT_798717 [Serendipita vermifera]
MFISKSTAFAITNWSTSSQHGARLYYRTSSDPGPAGQLGYLTSTADPANPTSYIEWNDNRAVIATELHPATKIAAANSFGTNKVGSPAFFQASDGRIVSWCNDAGSDAWNNLNVPAASTVAGTGIGALSFGNTSYTEFDVYFTDNSGNIYEVRRTSSDSAWRAPASISSGAVVGSDLTAVAWTETTGVVQKRLYFQHSSNYIRELRWSSTSPTWTYAGITAWVLESTKKFDLGIYTQNANAPTLALFANTNAPQTNVCGEWDSTPSGYQPKNTWACLYNNAITGSVQNSSGTNWVTIAYNTLVSNGKVQLALQNWSSAYGWYNPFYPGGLPS